MAPSERTTKPVSPPKTGQAVWVHPGQSVAIGGKTITGGMLYVGKSLKARDGYREENCLVDPALIVAALASSAGPGYWPSYAGLTPEQRRSFLDWAANGRCDPGIDIGYVFIFFYGLERRLFVDQVVSEAVELTAEVERLLGIYGTNSSFRNYANTFLTAARIVGGEFGVPEPEPISYSYEMPLSTRVHLGRLLAVGGPLDGSAALLWVLGTPETRLRTPGQRCFPELKELWKARFSERNPGGLKIRVPQRKLKLSYRAASGTFEADIPGSFQALPDVTAITAPLQGLRDLLETCMTELEPYSRLLGRRPEAKNTVEGAMLLPPAIRETAGRTAIEAAQSRLAALIGPEGMAVTTMARLAEALGTQTSATSSQAQATQLALMLDRLDVGMEPDRRYGTLSGSVDTSVVVFRASAGAPIAPGRNAYETARLAAEVGLIAATADGELSAVEIEALVTEARANESLEAHERLRIEAFIRNVQVTPPRLQSALKRAGQLSATQRLALAEAAVTAVMADGRADASEVRFLERLHKALQLPIEAVHAALHQRASGIPNRLVAVTAEERVPGVPLPEEDQGNRRNPSRVPAGLPLDQARLARIRAETSAVSRLLSEVFSETETPPSASDLAPAVSEGLASATFPLAGGGPSPYEGLDSAHGLVLSAVVREGPMPLDYFESECRKVGLLPGATMEAVNDWGFERHGELVLEENDELVSVPEHLLSSLAPN